MTIEALKKELEKYRQHEAALNKQRTTLEINAQRLMGAIAALEALIQQAQQSEDTQNGSN